MAAKLKPYPAMKDSGVSWLGAVPEHWDITALKRLAWFKSGTGFPIERQGQKDLEVPFFKVSDMNLPGNENVLRKWNNTISREISALLGAIMFPSGTIVFPKVGGAMLTNKRRVVERPCCLDNNIMGCVVQQGDPNFILLLLQKIDLGLIAKPGPVPAISEGEIREIRVVHPSLSEQTAIVRFLDHVDRRIRRSIRAKQKLIKLLEEQMRAIIHRAVTRGLDSDVRLKPSNVAWIEQIPEHWSTSRLGRFTSKIGDGLHGTPQYVEDSHYHFINGNNLLSGKVQITQSTNCVSEDEYEKYKIRLGETTLLLSINGTIGNVAYYGGEQIILGKSVAYINCGNKISRQYLFFLLRSPEMGNLFLQEATGTTILNLSLESLRHLPILLPPLTEQGEIVSFLEHEMFQFSELILNAENEIDLLREYRTRLISDVVTGKLDVRGVDLPATGGSEVPLECIDLLDAEPALEDRETQEELPAEDS